MATVVILCPNTGRRVKVRLADTPPTPPRIYEEVKCPACRLLHLVNRATGKVLFAKSGE